MIPATFAGRVQAAVAALGRGQLASYAQIAARVGHPGAARAVGRVLHDSAGLPWWRVVRSDGRLAQGHQARQARLLSREGVAVTEGRVTDARLRRSLLADPVGTPAP